MDCNTEYLDISGCTFIPESTINKTHQFCPKLLHLELGVCDISNATIREISRSCPNLKYPELEDCKNVSKKAIKKLDQNIFESRISKNVTGFIQYHRA